jgi:putative aldouronate transport system permease protein
LKVVSAVSDGVRRFINATLNIYVVAALLVVFAVTAYPFWYILTYSLSNPSKMLSGFLLYPKGINLQAYAYIFQNSRVTDAFLVSVARSVSGPILSTFVSMLAAYVLSHRDLPGRKFLTMFFLLTMYFGAGLIPYYLLIKSLHFINTFWVYIIPGMMNVFGMLLMRTYIETLPQSLEESALIDGANDIVIFFKITIPLCLPVIAAIALFSCVGHWNSYTDTLIYNSSSEKLYTLQYMLVIIVNSVYTNQNGSIIGEMIHQAGRARPSPMTVRMAITIVSIIPISMVYPFLQRYFIKGMLIGAIKG